MVVARIVLTGGPGAGKTVVAARLAQEHPDRFAVVPEAATQVYRDLRTRWDLLDRLGRREVQRRIYQLQVEQENRIAELHPGKTLLLDRGTIDGANYWPEGAADYWRELGTTHEAELARYDMVIWMQTCAAINAYDGGASNPCRFENAPTAVESGERLLALWKDHPNLLRVDAFEKVEQKISAVRQLLSDVLRSSR